MIAFFVLGGAALLLLIRPGLFSVGRDEGLLDLGFMQPGEPERHPVLGGAGASTGTDRDVTHKKTMQDMSVDEHLEKTTSEGYDLNPNEPLPVEGVVAHRRNWQLT